MNKNKIYRYGRTTVWTGAVYYSIDTEHWLFGTKEHLTFKTREGMLEAVTKLEKSGFTLLPY